MRVEQQDTIYALSSGSPPAGIAVVRVSGPSTATVVEKLAGRLPQPRRASYRTFKQGDGSVLDQGLLLWFPGPKTATGEDLAEFHLHGGRAVVSAMLNALGAEGLRSAEPGEFTRRAFANGRIDLAEAEGLGDLLSAETEDQRRAALQLAEGVLSRLVERWRTDVLQVSAQVEALLDFSDENDVTASEAEIAKVLDALVIEIGAFLGAPPAERLKDGILVAFGGPVNAGKSSLLNCLVGREVAITSSIPGTTRDLVEVPVALEGIPFRLVDTAGLRTSVDEIEAIGIAKAQQVLESADIILWLGHVEECPAPARSILVRSKSDLNPATDGFAVSAMTGEGVSKLVAELVFRARLLLPREGEVAIHARHRGHISACHHYLSSAIHEDLLITAEYLRLARVELDKILGTAGVEDMLDTLFGRFCVGK